MSSVASQRLSSLFSNAGAADYIGEPVSIEAHSLQAAARAAKERPDDREAIAAALLHDIGHMLGLEAGHRMGMDGCGVPEHERSGADFVRELGLPDRVARLVAAHVDAKRFLCWRDPAYLARLSEASRTTLRFQGGPMTDDEGRAWEADPDCDTYLQMRRWDELAKDSDATVPAFAHYSSIIDSLSTLGSAGQHVKYTVSEAQRAFWHEHGYLVLRGLANYGAQREVAAWAEEISRWPEAEGKWRLHWESATGKAEHRILCRAENFVGHHDGMRELAQAFLSNVVSQVVNEPTLLVKEEIDYKLLLTEDTPPAPRSRHRAGGDDRRRACAMVAIDAAAAEIDVPGRGGVAPEAEAGTSFAALRCEPGDVVLFDARSPCRRAQNTASKSGRAAFFTYSIDGQGDVRSAR